MSLRGIWVASLANKEVIFARRFPSVEARHKALNAATYKPIPNDAAFFSAFIASNEPHLARPALVQRIEGIWPVIIVAEDPLLYICVPSVSLGADTERLAVDTPEITLSAVFLRQSIALMRNLAAEQPERPELDRLAEYNALLSYGVPFGRLVDTNLVLLRSTLRQGFPEKGVVDQKQPAGMPFVLKSSRQQLTLTFREDVRAAQYDMESVTDVVEAAGQLICKAELDGVNDITLSLTNASSVRDVRVHACAQADDFERSSAVLFTPPLEPFPLLSYRIATLSAIPIRGYYQMKMVDARTVQILVQLKLGENMTNEFEYCQVLIPFSNRGPVESIDLTPTAGNVIVAPKSTSLIWNIGPRFPGKNKEVALPGTVTFAPRDVSASDSEKFSYEVDDNTDPFCDDHTCFIRIRFKMLEVTLSGMSVDAKSLVVYPGSTPRLTVTREVSSDNYVIWNSLGDARYALPLSVDAKR